jgi:hypothetical protein
MALPGMFAGDGPTPHSPFPVQQDIQLRIDDMIDDFGQAIDRGDDVERDTPVAEKPIDQNIAPFLVDEPVRVFCFSLSAYTDIV